MTPATLDVICGHAPASVGDSYGRASLEDMAAALESFPRFKIQIQIVTTRECEIEDDHSDMTKNTSARPTAKPAPERGYQRNGADAPDGSTTIDWSPLVSSREVRQNDDHPT